MLLIESDGGYHDYIVENDLKRQEHLVALSWKVVRFSGKDVKQEAEAVARAIARELGLEYEFSLRKATGSGMTSVSATKNKRV
jgi:very-short-patch-repair endonuclease